MMTTLYLCCSFTVAMKCLISFSLLVYLLIQQPSLSSASLLGAPEEIGNLNDPYVRAAANFAVLGINNLTNGKKVQVLVDVAKGTSQVVAGFRYSMVLKVGESDYCEKDKPLEAAPSLKECPVDMETVKMWHADVWMKPMYPPQFELLSLQGEDGKYLIGGS